MPSRSQNSLRVRKGIDSMGRTAYEMETASQVSNSAQRTAAIAFGREPPPANTVAPAVTSVGMPVGTAVRGKTQTTTTGTWSGEGTVSHAVQWFRGNTAISGATSLTYAPAAADIGFAIYARITATDDWGSTKAYSNRTNVIASPYNTAVPAITGTETEGSELTCSTGTWVGTSLSYAYQWKRDGVAIGSATASTYTLVEADVGTDISCTVTATDSYGTATADAVAVGPIEAL